MKKNHCRLTDRSGPLIDRRIRRSPSQTRPHQSRANPRGNQQSQRPCLLRPRIQSAQTARSRQQICWQNLHPTQSDRCRRRTSLHRRFRSVLKRKSRLARRSETHRGGRRFGVHACLQPKLRPRPGRSGRRYFPLRPQR